MHNYSFQRDNAGRTFILQGFLICPHRLVHDGDDVIIKKNSHFYDLGLDKVEVKMKRNPTVDGNYFFRLKVKTRE